jgi:hypothetical protein
VLSEPSTAAARWWPAVVFWARGTGMEAQARGVEGGVELWRDAWRSWQAGGGAAAGSTAAAGGMLCAGGRGSRGAAGARGRRRKGGGPRDLFEIFKNLRDPSVK